MVNICSCHLLYIQVILSFLKGNRILTLPNSKACLKLCREIYIKSLVNFKNLHGIHYYIVICVFLFIYKKSYQYSQKAIQSMHWSHVYRSIETNSIGLCTSMGYLEKITLISILETCCRAISKKGSQIGKHFLALQN